MLSRQFQNSQPPLSAKQFAIFAGLYGAGAGYFAYKRNKKKIQHFNKHFVKPVVAARVMAPYTRKRRVTPASASYTALVPAKKRKTVGGMMRATSTNWKVNPMNNLNMRRRRTVYSRYKSKNRGKAMKRRKVRRYKKKLMRKRNVRRDVYWKGSSTRAEGGGLAVDSYCVGIGHTLPTRQIRRTFFMAMIKLLIDKLGLTMEAPETTINFLTGGDQIYVYYRKGLYPLTPPTPLNFSYTCAVGDSLASITTGLIAAYEVAGIAGLLEDIVLDHIAFFPNGTTDLTAVRVSLIGCNVAFYFDSTLKLQNRTSDGVSNNQADDLVAQHCIGKSYYGPMNYSLNRARAQSSDTSQIDAVGDSTGVIGFVGTSNANGQLKEPAPKSQWSNCVSSANIRFNPGEMKKSHLKYENVLTLQEFFTQVVRRWDNSSAVVQSLQPYGVKYCNHRFFMIEKEIETVFGSAPLTPVTIGWEYDHTTGVVLYPTKNTYLCRENFIGTNISSI